VSTHEDIYIYLVIYECEYIDMNSASVFAGVFKMIPNRRYSWGRTGRSYSSSCSSKGRRRRASNWVKRGGNGVYCLPGTIGDYSLHFLRNVFRNTTAVTAIAHQFSDIAKICVKSLGFLFSKRYFNFGAITMPAAVSTLCTTAGTAIAHSLK